jgi:hypothetical protein
MLETFCASGNLKSLLLQHLDMPVIKEFKDIIEHAAKDHSSDPLVGVVFETVLSSTPPKQRQRGIVLSERARSALNVMYRQLFNRPMPTEPTCHSGQMIGKVSFTTRAASIRDCNIFFRSTTGVVAPGIIQYIVSIPSVATTSDMDTFFVIEPYAQSLEVTSNPFSSHVEFGASLWSSKMSSVLEAVPMDCVVCHAILRPWVKGVVVLKALDRVGDFLSLFVLFDSRRSRLSSLLWSDYITDIAVSSGILFRYRFHLVSTSVLLLISNTAAVFASDSICKNA